MPVQSVKDQRVPGRRVMKNHTISELQLEKYLLGESDPAAKKIIESSIKKSPELKKRLRVLQNSDKTILQEYDSAFTASQIKQRAESGNKAFNKGKTGIFKKAAIPSAAIAASLLLFIFFDPFYTVSPVKKITDQVEVTRIKGDETKIYLYRKNKSDIEILSDKSKAWTNDLLQIGYFTAKECYGIIVSVDGRGTVTLHYPKPGKNYVMMTAGKNVLLDSAYELDDAPAFEKFFLITGDGNINVDSVLKKMKLFAMSRDLIINHKPLLGDSLRITSITLIKAEQK